MTEQVSQSPAFQHLFSENLGYQEQSEKAGTRGWVGSILISALAQ
jgi:hypothetical protein